MKARVSMHVGHKKQRRGLGRGKAGLGSRCKGEEWAGIAVWGTQCVPGDWAWAVASFIFFLSLSYYYVLLAHNVVWLYMNATVNFVEYPYR